MTLGNMRDLGVRHLLVSCLNPECLHSSLLDVSIYPAQTPVPMFAPRDQDQTQERPSAKSPSHFAFQRHIPSEICDVPPTSGLERSQRDAS